MERRVGRSERIRGAALKRNDFFLDFFELNLAHDPLRRGAEGLNKSSDFAIRFQTSNGADDSRGFLRLVLKTVRAENYEENNPEEEELRDSDVQDIHS